MVLSPPETLDSMMMPKNNLVEILDRLTLFGREGGYILAPVHTVEPDVPLENVLALYETVKNFN